MHSGFVWNGILYIIVPTLVLKAALCMWLHKDGEENKISNLKKTVEVKCLTFYCALNPILGRDGARSFYGQGSIEKKNYW